jgi:hypothetical protein
MTRTQQPTQVRLISNILSFEIQSTPRDWAIGQLASAVRILDKPIPYPREFAEQVANREERIQAARVLRFLYTREAAEELVKRWDAASSDLPNAPPEAGDLRLGVRTSPFVDAAGHLRP